jgi:hypothetical protein
MKDETYPVHVMRQLIAEAQGRIGANSLTKAAQDLAAALKAGGFNQYALAGGYAVQHYGYVRGTQDIDAIVKERETIKHFLQATGKFKPYAGNSMRLLHRSTGVPLDLLPAGSKNSPTAHPYPSPDDAHEEGGLRFVTLPQLITMKLSANRAKDEADVIQLIKVNNLGKEMALELPADLADQYLAAWHRATAEFENSTESRLEAGGLYLSEEMSQQAINKLLGHSHP